MKIMLDAFTFSILIFGSFIVGAMFATKYIHQVFKHVKRNENE